MIERRKLLNTSVAATATAAVGGDRVAKAADHSILTTKFSYNDVEPRGSSPSGRLERLPELDMESRLDFAEGFRMWSLRDSGRKSFRRLTQLLKEADIDPTKSPPMKALLKIIGDDPIIWTAMRCKTTVQQVMWKNLIDGFHENKDGYLAELKAAEVIGPGSLELNAKLDVPEYAKHEIHIQPGGYIGDPLAGYVYHYGVNVFTLDLHSEDTFHRDLAGIVPVPEDGKADRILDLGTGIAQLPIALKERFPEADIWGIDVGAPMLRYGHMRAVEMGLEVNLAQRLAEDTKFDDNSFDVITGYILFHEVPTQDTRKILSEVSRILRPGGIFFPVDFKTYDQRPPTANSRLNQWWDHVYNNEVWTEEYRDSNFGELMREAGFAVSEDAPTLNSNFWNGLMGIKKA